MASTFSTANAHEDASGHCQPGETCAREAEVSASQGTNAVHGTWCSEGEAGRHLRTKAGYGPETPSPAPVPLRLERIATQAQLGSVVLECGRRQMTRVVCDVGQPRRMETCGAEEPYEGNLHVRLCGGIGRVIADHP